MKNDCSHERIAMAEMLFTPREAIKNSEVLAGRNMQIARVIRAIGTSGAHCIIYGERGAGKTSVAHCVGELLESPHSAENYRVLPVVNCDTSDDFTKVWRKAISQVIISEEHGGMGFRSQPRTETTPLSNLLPEEITPFDVQEVLRLYSLSGPLVITFDEFDRLAVRSAETSRLMADTMKGISDQGIPATIVIVGVGSSVADLVQGHESIGRHLVAVPMPRMLHDEQEEIMRSRLPFLGLDIDDDALELLLHIAGGIPYYVHLLALFASKTAILEGTDTIDEACIYLAMSEAIGETDPSLKNAYYQATHNPNAKNQLPATLAACAIADKDECGFSHSRDIVSALSAITGKNPSTSTSNARLKSLASEDRGNVLTATGGKHSRRFRFRDPLMQPFVIMKAISDNVYSLDALLDRPSKCALAADCPPDMNQDSGRRSQVIHV